MSFRLSPVRDFTVSRGKKIFVVSSRLGCEPDVELREVSSKSTRKLTETMLKECQFPELVGTIRKPKDWE